MKCYRITGVVIAGVLAVGLSQAHAQEFRLRQVRPKNAAGGITSGIGHDPTGDDQGDAVDDGAAAPKVSGGAMAARTGTFTRSAGPGTNAVREEGPRTK